MMRIEIKYEPDDEIDPAAAHLLADEIKASDQFGPHDTLIVSPITVSDRLIWGSSVSGVRDNGTQPEVQR